MEESGEFWASIFPTDPAILRAEAGISQLGDFAVDAFFDRDFDFPTIDQLFSVHPDHPSSSHVDMDWMAPQPTPTNGLGMAGLGPIFSEENALDDQAPGLGSSNYTDDSADGSPTQRKFGGRGRARSSKPTSSALANRRYHMKKKEKDREFSEHMRDMESRVAQLVQDTREEEVRNKVLMTDLATWQDHIGRLGAIKDVKHVQQCAALQKVAELMSCSGSKTYSLEEAMEWTVQDYIDHFRKLVERERDLCTQTLRDPNSGALQALEELMLKQREVRRKSGLGSCLFGSMMGYNNQVTRLGAHPLPTTSFWLAILKRMRLEEGQEEEILRSFRWMHHSLCKLAEERNSIILPQLAFETLSTAKDRMHLCPAAALLYHSLRNEQTVVIGFQMTLGKVLTSWQEAFLESEAYPWAPQWLVLCSLICEQRGEVPPALPTFDNQSMDIPILPWLTAIQILEVPILGLGLGMRGRQATLMCPFQSLLSKNYYPHASPDKLREMKLFDMIMGNEKTLHTWGWLQKVKEEGRLIENTLVEAY